MKKILMVLGVLFIITLLIFGQILEFLLNNELLIILGLILIIIGIFMVMKLSNMKFMIVGYLLIIIGVILLGIHIISPKKEKIYVDSNKIIYNLEDETLSSKNGFDNENIPEEEIISEQEKENKIMTPSTDTKIDNNIIVSNKDYEVDNNVNISIPETIISNKLLELKSSVGVFDKEFNQDINEYILTVPENTKEITLEGSSYDNVLVNGLGKIEINSLETVIEIGVLVNGTNNVNTYKVTIIREASTNTELESLIPSVGNIEYSNDLLEYELDVEENISEISFEVLTVDSRVTITGNELSTLNYGENEIIIKIIAEDKLTTREIKIKVTRKKGIIKIVPIINELDLLVGEEKEITYTLDPIDTSYTDVEWISNDENVVTVDEKGLVTAKKVGSTTVQIRSKYNPLITATININVIEKQITSQVYEINREGEVSYVIGSNPKTQITDFISNFNNNPSTLRLYDKDDVEITNQDTFIGSYMKIKLIINEVIYDELTVAVRGDLNGDGLVTSVDQGLMKKVILGSVEKNIILEKVSDLNKDNLITAPDITLIRNYILGKITIF